MVRAPMPAASPSSPYLSAHRAVSHAVFHSLPGRALPFLKSVFPEAPPASPRGSAVPCAGAMREPAVSGMRQPQPLLSEAPGAISWAWTPSTVM